MKVVDLSFTMETDMPTCGTPWHQQVKIESMGLISSVGRNTHRIIMGSHSGTHMDAPLHFIDNGADIATIQPERLVGKISVVNFDRFEKGTMVSLEDVRKCKVTDKMLFRFRWCQYWKTEQYYKDFPYFTTDAIQFLIDNGMQFMAMDTPSPDNGNAIANTEADSPNHKLLLENNVIIVEYLNNTSALEMDKEYTVVALPLRIKGSDGCPCRVIVLEEKNG